jgi:hypothetical protein
MALRLLMGCGGCCELMPDATVTVPAAAPSTATAALTTVSVTVGPTAATATGSGGGFAAGSVVSPAAAVATASGGTFTADQVFEPEAAVASASGPTPTVTSPSGSITVSPAAAAATARASNVWLLSDFLCGEYGAGFYGAGFYGICSVIEMSLFATTWDLAYTTDDASDPTPTWVNVDQTDVRSVDVARGRDDELGRVEAGTAQIVLNNLTRSFDPQVVTGLRPMNRWRVRAIHNAVTYDVFLGYAESYEQSWPGMGFDAVTTVRLVDEFKVLALAKLPAMDPPTAQTYADVIVSDEPTGYWRFGNESTGTFWPATVGPFPLSPFSGSLSSLNTPIVGDVSTAFSFVSTQLALSTTGYFATVDQDAAVTMSLEGPGDFGDTSAFTYEQWFRSSEATPAANRIIAEGPYAVAAATTWDVQLTTAGKIACRVGTGAGTVTATGATSISANTWYHIAATYDGANIRVYVNGVQDGIQAQTGTVLASDTAGANYYLSLGRGTPGGTRSYDEVAVYRTTLSASRLLARYTAGVSRGFATQDPGARITSVLAASTSVAASSVRSGSREMLPAFMAGQSPLDELRKAEDADSVDSMLFVSKTGTVTFLDDGHRSASPWNTVQCTFDDDGTDLGYRDLTYDYSETFLYNTVSAARIGGTTTTSTDATSVSRYHERLLSLAELPLTTDADVTSATTALLAKYKDPMTRITSIGVFLYDTVTISEVLSLELADRIRILRTHPAGGARIDQTAFVQKIQLSSRPGQPITVTLGVSPL